MIRKLLIKTLRLIFDKLLGVEKLPKDKKEEYLKKLESLLHEVVVEVAEEIAHG